MTGRIGLENGTGSFLFNNIFTARMVIKESKDNMNQNIYFSKQFNLFQSEPSPCIGPLQLLQHLQTNNVQPSLGTQLLLHNSAGLFKFLQECLQSLVSK